MTDTLAEIVSDETDPYKHRAGPDSHDQPRANMYALLATLLAKPPSAEIVAMLREIDDSSEPPAAALGAAWQALRMAADYADPGALDDEYHALFIGIGRGELVPYASWYMTGFLMDRPLAYLRRDLAALGMERQNDVSEPEDHAAALCEAMSVIIQSPDIVPEVQKEFFQAHLGPWIPRWSHSTWRCRTETRLIGVRYERLALARRKVHEWQ
jgi:TorA maturation chaperone TorD